MPKRRSKNRSTIADHKRQGSTLTPPLATLPKLQPSSWQDERLPEMLWAALLVAHLPRPVMLTTFRRVADYVHSVQDRVPMHDVTLTGLSLVSQEDLEGLLQILCESDEHKEALVSLLLLENLPAKDSGANAISLVPTPHKWVNLMHAVALTLDHQSQEATDCRWVRLMCLVAGGQAIMPPEHVKEIAYYPEYGEQRSVRPSIRAAEMAFWDLEGVKRDWADHFWEQCLSDTGCYPLDMSSENTPRVGTTLDKIREVYALLTNHCNQTRTTSKPDPRHEVTFGIALYCLGILQELMRIGASESIMARTGLRTIIESLISLAYLATKDNLELWQSYRVFGAGQAKLSFLKLEDQSEGLSYINMQTLETLANEDVWEEFLSIELGHWEKSNIRRMSEEANVKDIYDRYYSWTSTYTHGHWGALREAVYDICGNPLHRLHRIPRQAPRMLPDVLPDACTCIDKILDFVAQCYPDFPHRVTLKTN